MRRSIPSNRRSTRLEFLRENAHLRFRTNTYSAVFRMRHQVSFGIHEYFDQQGYNYFHSADHHRERCGGCWVRCSA
jgi:asparaginyl-tRNA synthetase